MMRLLMRRHAIAHLPRRGSNILRLLWPTTNSSKYGRSTVPENFENRAALVGAEIARIDGRAFDAMNLYEQAILSAQANGFVHNEALANELAARFYAACGFEQIAHLYLRNARRLLPALGRATERCGNSMQLYPRLRMEEPAPASDKHDRSTCRTTRSRDGDQSVASDIGRDRAGEAARHTHAHGA